MRCLKARLPPCLCLQHETCTQFFVWFLRNIKSLSPSLHCAACSLSAPSLCQTKWSNFNCWKSRHHANPASSMQVHLTIILCQFCRNLFRKKGKFKRINFNIFCHGGWLMITVSIGLLTKFNMTLRNWLCSANLTWNPVITPVRSQIFVKRSIILHLTQL